MQPSLLIKEDSVAASHHGLFQAYECDITDEMQFFAAWEKGLIPWLSAFLRVRQIRRVHPDLYTQSRSGVVKA